MTAGLIALASGAFGLGVGIGFVWGELKASRETKYAQRLNDISKLRRLQNTIPGNVRKEVRTNDPK